MPGVNRQRIWTLLLMAGLVPVGLASKFYAGPGAWWSRAYLGGVLYEVFWCLAAFLLWPRARLWVIAAWVLAVTSALEVLQLWHPAWLQALRASFLGAALLGATFAWWDFACYGLGVLLAWGIMGWLRGRAL
jgi:hypothetical protein